VSGRTRWKFSEIGTFWAKVGLLSTKFSQNQHFLVESWSFLLQLYSKIERNLKKIDENRRNSQKNREKIRPKPSKSVQNRPNPPRISFMGLPLVQY